MRTLTADNRGLADLSVWKGSLTGLPFFPAHPLNPRGTEEVTLDGVKMAEQEPFKTANDMVPSP